MTLLLLALLLMTQSVFALQLVSSAFPDGGVIPGRYTCEGQGEMVPLSWSAPPEGTKSLVLVMVDPDAPNPAHPIKEYVHYLAYNLPPRADSLSEFRTLNRVQPGLPGFSSTDSPRWAPLCPPIGRHRYYFKLFALDARLMFSTVPHYSDVMRGVELHKIAETSLMGTYQKGDIAQEAIKKIPLEKALVELDLLDGYEVMLSYQGADMLMPEAQEPLHILLTDAVAQGELLGTLPVVAFIVEVSWGTHTERELVLAAWEEKKLHRMTSLALSDEQVVQRLDFIGDLLRISVFNYRPDDKPGLPTQESLRYYELQNNQLVEIRSRRKYLN